MPFPGLGGTEIATLRIIRASRGYGVEHVALYFEPEDKLLNAFRQEHVPAFPCERPFPSLLRHSVRFWRQSQGLARELKRLKVDLVHCAATFWLPTPGGAGGTSCEPARPLSCP